MALMQYLLDGGQLQWVDEIIFQAVRLKLGRVGFHQWLEDAIFI